MTADAKSTAGPASEGSVRAVERALGLLEQLSVRRDGATASELARAAGLSVSTTHRLLLTLQGKGFVRCDRESTRWRVGRAAFSVGSAFAPERSLGDLALPVLRDLALTCGETVNLGQVEDGRVVFLARFDPRLRVYAAPRSCGLPAHCSSIGKAILASGNGAQTEFAGAGSLLALTPKSIRIPSDLTRELAASRTAGFAVDDEENTVGLRCIAAPVFDGLSRAVAAVSIAAPLERLPRETFTGAGAMVRLAAQRLTAAIGGVIPRGA